MGSLAEGVGGEVGLYSPGSCGELEGTDQTPQKPCERIFLTQGFVTAKTGKQSTCLSADEWMMLSPSFHIRSLIQP